jgi:hypothetical protein
MTNQLREPGNPNVIRGIKRAPEVFMILDALMRPQPTPDLELPELKQPIRPYLPAVEIEPLSNRL